MKLTLEDLRRELATGLTSDELGQASDDERLLWWRAVRDAEDLLEDGLTRETLADILLGGRMAMSVAGVREWLDRHYGEYAKDCDLTEDEVTDEILEDLKRWRSE